MTPSRRSLLGAAPPALLGLLGFALPPLRPVRAKTTSGATPYDPPYDPLTQVWECTYNECDPYYYDPQKGDAENIAGSEPIPPGTAFEDLPKGWLCPICGAPKRWFVKYG